MRLARESAANAAHLDYYVSPYIHLSLETKNAATPRSIFLEKLITQTKSIFHTMTHPNLPGRRLADARTFSEPREGVDEPAAIGSSWEPKEHD